MGRLRAATTVWGVLAALWLVPAAAQEEADPADALGHEILQRTAARLAELESFSFESQVEYDVLQDFGQMLEFGATRAVQVRRPDRLRIDAVDRSGERRELYYDGRAITFWVPEQKFYAQVPLEGTLDGAIDYMDERLDQIAPLAELIHSDLPKMLSELTRSVFLVGEETLDGVRCQHVAVAGEDLDWQIWVGADDALPRRVTISYHTEGRPGFRSELRNWNAAARLDDATFAFEPPPGAARIPVIAERPPAEGER